MPLHYLLTELSKNNWARDSLKEPHYPSPHLVVGLAQATSEEPYSLATLPPFAKPVQDRFVTSLLI